MSEIPTAEDILIKNKVLWKTIEESGHFPLNLSRDTHISTVKNIKSAMIEFAKLHVQEALKKASDEVKIIQKVKENVHELSMMDDWLETFVDKSSILNAYPEENIK